MDKIQKAMGEAIDKAVKLVDPFPIYCKSPNGVHAFMIISRHQVLTLTNSGNEISISLTQDESVDHETYQLWLGGELDSSNSRDFNFQRIQTNNPLISLGVSKEAQTTKSES